MQDVLKFEVIDADRIIQFFGIDEEFAGFYIEMEVFYSERKSIYTIHLFGHVGAPVEREYETREALREHIKAMRKAVVIYGPFDLV